MKSKFNTILQENSELKERVSKSYDSDIFFTLAQQSNNNALQQDGRPVQLLEGGRAKAPAATSSAVPAHLLSACTEARQPSLLVAVVHPISIADHELLFLVIISRPKYLDCLSTSASPTEQSVSTALATFIGDSCTQATLAAPSTEIQRDAQQHYSSHISSRPAHSDPTAPLALSYRT